MFKLKLALNDVMIIPEVISGISSRKECKYTYPNGNLPLFTAPMDTVIDEFTYQNYYDNNIIPIIPRTVSYEKRKEMLYSAKHWVSVGLSEFRELLIDTDIEDKEYKVLIDVANGHMHSTLNMITEAKEKLNNIIIMAGNIANPKTIIEYCKVGVDFVRVGIGAGSGCTTSSNTAIHYPIASLINETYTIREEFDKFYSKEDCKNYKKTLIVADGGMRNYSDINKALGLGADYVMLGGIFASTLEAPGDVYIVHKNFNERRERIYSKSNFNIKNELGIDSKLVKQFYGMSTKKAQKIMGKEELTTSEGVVKTIEVKYHLSQWVENYISYLTSAMSYTNSRTLKDFIGNVEFVRISNNGLNSFNK